jgi:RNA polymerase sigma-70 factor (ECF subfamily)
MAADVQNLYARYGALIYSHCRRLLRDPAAAEGATQEVFLRLYRKLPELDESAAVQWLSRQTVSHCEHVLREAQRIGGGDPQPATRQPVSNRPS